MAFGLALGFWAMSALLVLVPGADWAYVIAAGLRDRAVWPAVTGILLGYVVLTAVVAAGVAALVARTPVVLTALTFAGAAYLVWLGAGILARPPALPAVAGRAVAGPAVAGPAASGPMAGGSVAATPGRALVRGFGVSGLNPKGLLLFLALLPQFTDPGGTWPAALQIALLGALHTANCGAGYLGVGVLARSVLRARPTAARLTTRFSGAAMVILGVALLAEHWV
ncbi:LysE family translocator [Paractinoplanes globisporus]|uniref:LysE family translocator n=1 Tax=Paractinoplanes globisporus TaxID=113565 RepID=A0ABW6WSF5_9ACTN|nr:LysE family transporter [Actinoplanes globisporus]